jgi:hypothetical protein
MADSIVNFTLSGSSVAANVPEPGATGGPTISGYGTLDIYLSSTLGDYIYPSNPVAAANTYNINVIGSGLSISIGGGPSLSASVIYSDPNNVATYGYSYYYLPGGGLYYDNALTAYWQSTLPYLTNNGLLFSLSDGSILSIFYDNYGDAYNDDYLWNQYQTDGSQLISNAEGGDPVSLDVFTPEPSSLMLLGTGLLCMAGLLFWKAKPSMVRVR